MDLFVGGQEEQEQVVQQSSSSLMDEVMDMSMMLKVVVAVLVVLAVFFMWAWYSNRAVAENLRTHAVYDGGASQRWEGSVLSSPDRDLSNIKRQLTEQARKLYGEELGREQMASDGRAKSGSVEDQEERFLNQVKGVTKGGLVDKFYSRPDKSGYFSPDLARMQAMESARDGINESFGDDGSNRDGSYAGDRGGEDALFDRSLHG